MKSFKEYIKEDTLPKEYFEENYPYAIIFPNALGSPNEQHIYTFADVINGDVFYEYAYSVDSHGKWHKSKYSNQKQYWVSYKTLLQTSSRTSVNPFYMSKEKFIEYATLENI